MYGLTAIIFFIYRHPIYDWMLHDRPSLPVIFLLALGFVLFPVLPFKIVIGMLGIMYGPLLGALISWTAASAASVIVYMLVKTTFHEQGRAYLAKFKQMEKLKRMMEKNPFITLLIARLIPIFPQALINIYPAFLSIRLRTYVAASALGKIPAMLVYAYLGSSLLTDGRSALIAACIYVAFLALILTLYKLWLSKKA
ncbi:TVP38/TMEM64 family protein [Paenibacillus piri]|nr:VTT domain-containing protein [Paenibacillus piri]